VITVGNGSNRVATTRSPFPLLLLMLCYPLSSYFSSI
jgi:hypothetical protein